MGSTPSGSRGGGSDGDMKSPSEVAEGEPSLSSGSKQNLLLHATVEYLIFNNL